MVEEEEEGDQGLWECKVASINVNGLLAKGVHKKTDIEVTVKEEDIDVLLLQETKVTREVDISQTYIEGYTEVRQAREGRGGGGVSTYVKNGRGIVCSKGFSNGYMEVLVVCS